MTRIWIERIDNRRQAVRWPSPSNRLALEYGALATAEQLIALEKHIRKVSQEIAQSFKELPEGKLMENLPGTGEVLAPESTLMAAPATS